MVAVELTDLERWTFWCQFDRRFKTTERMEQRTRLQGSLLLRPWFSRIEHLEVRLHPSELKLVVCPRLYVMTPAPSRKWVGIGIEPRSGAGPFGML